LVIYHATFVALHGPENNLMTIGNQIANQGQSSAPPPGFSKLIGSQLPPTFLRSTFTTAQLDEFLNAWTASPSFTISVEHAGGGTRILEVMSKKLSPESRRDTPFLGFCVCQLGLLNLIAARQLALLDRNCSPVELKILAQVAIGILAGHSNVFSASNSGRKLLEKIMIEISGGEMTMDKLSDMWSKDPQSVGYREGGDEMMSSLIRANTSKTIGVILDEPGMCAGTMMVMTGNPPGQDSNKGNLQKDLAAMMQAHEAGLTVENEFAVHMRDERNDQCK
jgi:hypothetical protein